MTQTVRRGFRWMGLVVFALPFACSDGGASEPASAAGAAGTTGGAAGTTGGAAGTTGGAAGTTGGAGGKGGAAGTGGAATGGASGAGGTATGGAGGQVVDSGRDAAANFFSDQFDAWSTSIWSCEYSCPTVSGGTAKFRLLAGIAPDNQGSWSKIRYKPRQFTSGKFTVRFALTARPTQRVWWGVALWDDGVNGQFNEINFGYTTNQSFTNTQLWFESARLGQTSANKIDTGVDLYDGSYHTGTLEYDSTHVSFYFDGKLMKTVTDPNYIPTDPMSFIIGPRLVTGSAPLTADFTETVDWTEIEW